MVSLAALPPVHLSHQTRFLALALACLFGVLVVELIRRRKLQERYTVLWFIYALVLFLIAAAPATLGLITSKLGIADPNAALFALAFTGVGFMLLSLTVSHSRQSEQITKLAQELSLLKMNQEQATEDQLD